MLKRRILSALMFLAAFVATVSLLGAAISRTTHRPINQAPRELMGLPGVVVTVVKKGSPGAKPQSVVTDNQGRFSFDVLPSGTYALTLSLPDAAVNKAQTKMEGPATPKSIEAARVSIAGTTEGSLERGWDFKGKKVVDLAGDQILQKAGGDQNLRTAPAPAKPPQLNILFTSDGKQKVTGKVHEMLKSIIQPIRA